MGCATQLASWLWDKVSGWISSIWDGICDYFGIHSPSKEMAWVGEMLVKGLAGSIDDNGDEAVKAAEGMNCFKDTTLKNDTVTGDGFPMLKPGTTTIACAGNVQRIEVIPRWCCL